MSEQIGPRGFWSGVLAVGLLIVVVNWLDTISPRAAWLLVAAVILSVALLNQSGVARFASWFQSQIRS